MLLCVEIANIKSDLIMKIKWRVITFESVVRVIMGGAVSLLSIILLISCSRVSDVEQLRRDAIYLRWELRRLSDEFGLPDAGGGLLVRQDVINKMSEKAKSEGFSLQFGGGVLNAGGEKLGIVVSDGGREISIKKYKGEYLVIAEVWPSGKIEVFRRELVD